MYGMCACGIDTIIFCVFNNTIVLLIIGTIMCVCETNNVV